MYKNGHFETLFPYFLRSAPKLAYTRERIGTSDGDFLDLDWIKEGHNRVVVLSHGLESNSQAKYIKGMAKLFIDHEFDVVAWNYRGCSEEINKTINYYHSGATYDLHTVVEHIVENKNYEEVYLIGFSLGGNLTLKYLGEDKYIVSEKIKKAVAISAPVCLKTSSHQLKSGFNKVYTNTFLKTLRKKVYAKEKMIKEFGIEPSQVYKLKNLPEFDEVFTAPIHGFKNADDYYKKSSSKQFIENIKIPTLILNAKNDPFLSPECYPYKEVSLNKNVTFLDPDRGGHVGFYNPFKKDFFSESETKKFIIG